MSDVPSGLDARDDMLWVVAQWGRLRAHLRPGAGGALGVKVSTSDRPSPINLAVSDLMFQIEETARFYGRILMDETEWEPPTSAMPRLLSEVALRYGHFVTVDVDAMGLGFLDDAHEMRRKVTKVLERPAPPTYIGPCQGDNCGGELYVGDGKTAGTCRECGQPFTLAEQRAWLDAQMEDRLMTAAELPRALKILGIAVQGATVRKWVERKRLVEVVKDEGLYRLADAKALAERGRVA